MSHDTAVNIEFSTPSSGEGDLTAGQRYIWDIIEALAPHDEHLNMAFPIDIPAGTSISQVLSVMRRAIERYDTLRTFFPRRADGIPCQRLNASGTLPVTLRDTASERDIAYETTRLVADLARGRFDTTQPGLLRCGVVTRRSQPRQLVLCLSHILADAIGAWTLSQELRQQLSQEGSDPRQPDPRQPDPRQPDPQQPDPQQAEEADRPWQPLDQLAFEQTEAGRIVAARSLAYWRDQLASARLDAPPSAESASSPRYWHGSLVAPRITLASRRLAYRWKMSSNSVLLVAAGLLLSHVSVEDAPLLIMRVSNRTPGPTQHAIGHYSQAVPIRFDLAGESFGLVARNVHRTAITAYRYGRYQPSDLTELLADLGKARGTPEHVFNCFNSIRQTARDHDRTDYEPVGVPDSSFRWIDKREVEAFKTFLYIHPEDEISLFADTAIISPSGIEEFLRALERMLVAADDGEDSLSAIHRLIGG